MKQRAQTTCQGPKVTQWEDQKDKLALGNLAMHFQKAHKDIPAQEGLVTNPQAAISGRRQGYTAASAKLMEAYLEEGCLNPKLEPMQLGFKQTFTASCSMAACHSQQVK